MIQLLSILADAMDPDLWKHESLPNVTIVNHEATGGEIIGTIGALLVVGLACYVLARWLDKRRQK